MENKSTASKSRTTLVEVSRVNPSYRRGYVTRRPSPLQVSRSTSRVTDLLLNELRLQLKSRGEIHRLEGRWHPLVPAFATGQRYRCARRVNQTSSSGTSSFRVFFFFCAPPPPPEGPTTTLLNVCVPNAWKRSGRIH